MTLEEHAKAIEAAVNAAREDGFYLDNGRGGPVGLVVLNDVFDRGRSVTETSVTLDLPPLPMS